MWIFYLALFLIGICFVLCFITHDLESYKSFSRSAFIKEIRKMSTPELEEYVIKLDYIFRNYSQLIFKIDNNLRTSNNNSKTENLLIKEKTTFSNICDLIKTKKSIVCEELAVRK